MENPNQSYPAQLNYWIKLGRIPENHAPVGFTPIDCALRAEISPDELTAEDAKVYIDALEAAMALPSDYAERCRIESARKVGEWGYDSHESDVLSFSPPQQIE